MFEAHNIYTVKQKVVFDSFDFSEGFIKTSPSLSIHEQIIDDLEDGYRMHVDADYKVVIKASNPRGFNYARRLIKKTLAEQHYLWVGRYDAKPSFPIRGIIEGFYGEPWSHEDRLDMLTFCDEFQLNAYMYAPKDDLFHRDFWRDPYPKDTLEKIAVYIEQAHQRNIDFYYCISPGKDFHYNKSEDIEALNAKVDQISALGCRHFCLLMDDIDYTLASDDQAAFETPGKAHAYIANTLLKHLENHIEHPILILCPTEYWQNYDTPYRQDIRQSLHPKIHVFWTGYNTIAEFIPNEDGQVVQESFQHPLVLWDNYPVNDVTQDLIFLGPLVNRGDALHQTHVGMVANPMIQWHLSKLALMTMAEYMWNTHTYHSENAYQGALRSLVQNRKSLVEDLSLLVENFRYSILSYDTDDGLEKAILDKDIATLAAYYQNVIEAVQRLKQEFINPFMTQLEPWIKRLFWDHELLIAIKQEDHAIIQAKIQELPTLTHTVGTNYVVKLAKALGYYEGPVYKKQRINFWEANHA